MRTKLTLVFLLTIWATGWLQAQKPQKGDSVVVESESVAIKIPRKKIPEIKVQTPPDEVFKVETAIQKELKEYVAEMQNLKFISGNVVTEVNVEKENDDLKVVYSYYLINDTLKFQTDDFGLGKYRVDESNALQVTLGIMKKTMEGQLAMFVTPQVRISLTINGSADATPVKGTIEYKGEYGNPITEICTTEKVPTQMDISTKKGIADNPSLAFIRSYAVKNYIEKNIIPLEATNNKWQYSAFVSGEKGGKFCRVSIEMIVFDALKSK